LEIAFGCVHDRDGAPIARSFERIESLPVVRKIARLDELDSDRWSCSFEDYAGIAEFGAPTLLE